MLMSEIMFTTRLFVREAGVPNAARVNAPTLRAGEWAIAALVVALTCFLPAGARAQDECASIPEHAGATGLIFNADGQQVYYERSRCFMEHALRSGDVALCDKVLERRSLLFDGSYYSVATCRRLVARARAAEAAPKVAPGSAYLLEAVTLTLEGQEARVRFALSPDGVAGIYGIDLRFEYVNGGTRVGGSFNPESPSIEYHNAFERFAPVRRWVAEFESEHEAIEFRLSGRHFEETLAARRAGVPVTLTAMLEILRAESGAIPDPSLGYESVVSFELPASGSVRATRPE